MDYEAGLLAALTAEGPACEDTLWDELCLALLLPSGAHAVEALAAVDLTRMPAERLCLLGLYAARLRKEESHGAAHFARAFAQGSLTLSVGPATFECRTADGVEAEVTLLLANEVLLLGRLDTTRGVWVDCRADALAIPHPSEWDTWTTTVRNAAVGLSMVLEAVNAHPGAVRDTGFRGMWKDFQHALGAERDRLEAPAELREIAQLLESREKAALRGTDAARRVSALVDASRDDVRTRSDALRLERAHDLATQARQAFERAFNEGGFDHVAALRDELRRETSSAHAEMRKSLDYQARLLRGAQEALHASLAELERRAGSLLWPLTPRTLFDEAREQADLVVERAREVAMIEQTDSFLVALSPMFEAAAEEVTTDLAARRALLESWSRGYAWAAHTLSLPLNAASGEAPGALRSWVLEMPPTATGVSALLASLRLSGREPALSGAR